MAASRGPFWGGLRLRTCCNRLADSLVGRRILPLARRQRKVKNERDLVIVLVGRRRRVPFDREIRQAGGD